MNIPRIEEFRPSTRRGRWMSEEYEPGLVSVIIPAYNRAQMVTEAMDSVFAQTYRPIELIVVDDGSNDNTSEIIEEWGRSHSNDPGFQLRCFRQENGGAASARNRGLVESRGEFIQFLDCDDLMRDGCIDKKQGALREAGNISYAYGKSERVDENGNIRGCFGRPWPDPGKEGVISGYYFCTSGPLIRRSVCIIAGPWNEEVVQDEIEYFARLKFACGEGVFVDRIGETIRIHSGARMSAKGAERHAESGIEVNDMIARMIENSEFDTPAERRTISACFRSTADSCMFADRPDLAVKALERSAEFASGWRRISLKAILLMCRIAPKGFVIRSVYRLRRFLNKSTKLMRR